MTLQSQLERITAKGQMVALTFMQDAVAASQTDVDLPIVETGATSGDTAVKAYEAPYSFDIVAMSYTLSAAATAGVLTINPTVAGTVDTGLNLSVTTAAAGYTTASGGAVSGKAGDAIGVQIDTNAAWNATTADLAVTLFVIFYLDNV